jgi:hypothetical protein
MGSSLSCIGNKAHEHATNEQPISDLDLDKPLSIVRATPERESNWTFPLPEELMAKICDILSQEKALETLATLQSVSSCSYTLATPFLYRHIIFDTRQALLFLDLFNNISRRGKQKFLEFNSGNSGAHLLDQKLAVRLRSVMTHTQSLTFLAHEEMRLQYPKDYNRLKGFFGFLKLQNLLELVGDQTPRWPALWPALERCHIDLDSWPVHSSTLEGRRSSPDKVILPEMSPLIDILFARLHPQNMSIIIPNRLVDIPGDICMDTGATFWWMTVRKLHADHIELAGLHSTGILEFLPRASKSLTIRTDRLPPYNPNVIVFESEAARLGSGVTQRAVHELRHRDRGGLYQIDSLRLIGIIKSSECDDVHPYHWFEQRILAGVPDAMVGLMDERLKAGNKRDFSITIMPDTTPKSEAEAVWHTFKVPEVE